MVNYSPFQMISIHIIESLVGTVVLYFFLKNYMNGPAKNSILPHCWACR